MNERYRRACSAAWGGGLHPANCGWYHDRCGSRFLARFITGLLEGVRMSHGN